MVLLTQNSMVCWEPHGGNFVGKLLVLVPLFPQPTLTTSPVLQCPGCQVGWLMVWKVRRFAPNKSFSNWWKDLTHFFHTRSWMEIDTNGIWLDFLFGALSSHTSFPRKWDLLLALFSKIFSSSTHFIKHGRKELHLWIASVCECSGAPNILSCRVTNLFSNFLENGTGRSKKK